MSVLHIINPTHSREVMVGNMLKLSFLSGQSRLSSFISMHNVSMTKIVCAMTNNALFSWFRPYLIDNQINAEGAVTNINIFTKTKK